MAKVLSNLFYAITIYGVVFYLKSRFHFDDGTINAIMETGCFYANSIHIQFQAFVDKDEQLCSSISVLSIL
jgi:hypothetical protein